ncbi:MAG: efflux RND transporter permease subunit, partial [Bacteroidales bacterium]
MIVRNLINRPVAVSMFVVALMVVGLVSLKFIPVSLMPDIDIPQITVQVSYPGASVREMESKVLRPLRNQLMQVNGLKSIRSESRTDAGTVFMSFEPGSNIDLLFIEVNEKMDRAVNAMPKEMERPKVLKASATDIPAFYLDLTIKDEMKNSPGLLPAAGVSFAQLGDFARNIVSKRIEQLPQTAMVDISGLVSSELLCIPDEKKMKTMGVSTDVLEKAISDNNITLGVLSIADGLYRYNIHFDSQLMTREDIENIYINHNGRIFQFKDLCEVIEKPAKRKGLVRNGRNNAVTMAIIKQNDAQMEELQYSIANLIKDLEKEYPNVRFQLTRDQTQLLSYSIENLKGNLLLGALLASLVLFLFMRNIRLPFLIIITIPLSLVLTLLCFHLLGITLNIISLSGLILGLGMMVDNSIIVIDNITQKWKKGIDLKEAIVQAVGEVFSPMLSSVLTTCSVFIPLVFLSGISGALFYDQAMAVTIALFASLLVAVLVIPVYFQLFFKNKKGVDANRALTENFRRWWQGLRGNKSGTKHRSFTIYRPYERILKWVMRHQYLVLGV